VVSLKKSIKKSPQTFFSNFVPNYKDLATVFQIFHPKTKTKSRILLEKQLIEKMTTGESGSNKDMKPIDNLTYKTFVKKFNERYSNSLLEEQKNLLSKFIGSFSDNGIDLKVYLSQEIPRLFEIVANSVSLKEVSSDKDMLEKTNKVISMLKETSSRKIDKDLVFDILNIQNLAREME